MRFFSSNTDGCGYGELDVGFVFDNQCMPALAALARKDQDAINRLTDDQIAMARSCLMCVIPKDLKLMESNTRTTDQTQKAEERRARQRAFESAKSSHTD